MEKRLKPSGAKRQTENTKDPEGNAQGKDPCDHQPHKMGKYGPEEFAKENTGKYGPIL